MTDVRIFCPGGDTCNLTCLSSNNTDSLCADVLVRGWNGYGDAVSELHVEGRGAMVLADSQILCPFDSEKCHVLAEGLYTASSPLHYTVLKFSAKLPMPALEILVKFIQRLRAILNSGPKNVKKK